MAKAKAKKGARLACVPCGREVIVTDYGISRETIWCCGAPMKKKAASPKKRKARSSKKK